MTAKTEDKDWHTVATLTIHGAGAMTDEGRHEVALWLRREAAKLDATGGKYGRRYAAKYSAKTAWR